MRTACISAENCPYKSDTGYCGYTGNSCVNELVHSIRIDAPSYKIIRQIDISDESIEKIADAVANKLHQIEADAKYVIRCKNCKIKSNDFCSYAKRKGEAKE